MVPNALIRSATLSLKAKGRYCLLFSKPDNWIYLEEALIKESADGREAYRSGIKELVDSGWLNKVQVRDDKGVLRHIDWHLSVDGTPVDGEAVVGQLAAGKSPHNNTDDNNTDIVIPSVSPKPKTKAPAVPTVQNRFRSITKRVCRSLLRAGIWHRCPPLNFCEIAPDRQSIAIRKRVQIHAAHRQCVP